MSNENNEDVYEVGHVSDPVAARAAAEAVAATDPPPRRHKWLTRFVIILASVLIIAGMVGTILGAINTVVLGHQSEELRTQQVCTTYLISVIADEQNARANIAGDDRHVLRNMVDQFRKAFNEHNFALIPQAINTFERGSHANDVRRSKIPNPDPDKLDACKSTIRKTGGFSHLPDLTVTPSNNSPKSKSGTASSKPHAKKSGASASPKAHSTVSNGAQPPANAFTHARPAPAPQGTTTLAQRPTQGHTTTPASPPSIPFTRPAPAPSSTSSSTPPPPIIRIPKPLPTLVCLPGIIC